MTDLVIDKEGHTTILTINRPERMNALTWPLIDEVTAAMQDFQADPSQYVAIITGAGDRAFSAGADLKEMAKDASSGSGLPISPAPDAAGIAACEKVTIAAINGLAVGGGLEIAISCDIRIAAERAWFALYEVKRGLIAGVAANILPRLMPMGAVMDLMLSGDQLPSTDALRLGLVQQVVADDTVLERALQKAHTIAQNSQVAVWGTKQVLKFWRDAMLAEQQRYYEAVVHRVLLSGDVHEGPRAFAEKREAKFCNAWPSAFQTA